MAQDSFIFGLSEIFLLKNLAIAFVPNGSNNIRKQTAVTVMLMCSSSGQGPVSQAAMNGKKRKSLH